MITIVLVKSQEPGNIGAIARGMANFELNDLILIEPLCNHLDEEALKRGKHGNYIVKKAVVKRYNYFSKLKKDFDLVIGTTSLLGTDYNIPRTPLFPEDAAKKINEKQKVALLFGNEAQGLSNEEIKTCDFIINIPTSKKYPAMNISHAAAIIFYELFKESFKKDITDRIKPASRKERSIMMEKINNIIDGLDFATKEKKETQRIAWQRIIEKSMLSKREAFAALGLLKKIEDRVSKSQSYHK
jgi:tRNA/rRNA methyltransferase